MKHLVIIIKKTFPKRMFSLKEVYEPDEVGNTYVEYQLWIQDICSEYFSSFQRLEDFIYDLYKKDAVDQACYFIKGKKRGDLSND